MKKFFKKNQTWLLILALVILLLAIFVPVKIKESRQNETKPTITSKANAAELTTPDSRKNVSVPILMFHHIRDYENPNDSIGTGLSVSPELFKSEIDYLKNNGYTTITFADFVAFPQKQLPAKPVIITFDDGYQDGYDVAYKDLKDNGQVGVFYIISDFIGQPDEMTVTEIKEISNGGMEIGSHTLSHPALTKISLPDAKLQIFQSKTAIEEVIGKPVISFCYPSGKHNTDIDNLTHGAGYSAATTTASGIATTSDNKFTLSRLRMNHTDTLKNFISILK